MIMETIIAIVAAFGIANILGKGSIFQRQRDWLEFHSDTFYKLITCPMCIGFWIGLGLGIAYGPFPWWNPLNGAFYSATTWIIHCAVQFLGAGYDPSRTINIVTTDPITIREEKP
jgi:hypothetical protein